MNRVALDASAILAAILQEPGTRMVMELLPHAVVSSVNMAEVKGKLMGRGLSPADAWGVALSYASRVISFDSEQAGIAGGLVSAPSACGLSLEDRACLALGLVLDAPVYTADRAWQKIGKLGIEIRLLR